MSQSWLVSYLQVSWTLFGGPGKRVRYLGKLPTNHIWIRGKLDERIHLVGHSLGAHLMGKVSTSPSHIWTSIKNSYHLMFCIKQIYSCYLLPQKVFVPHGCTYSRLAEYIIIYSVSTKTFAIMMNSRLAVYSKTISELLWQGLQVVTVQLCKIFLFVRR